MKGRVLVERGPYTLVILVVNWQLLLRNSRGLVGRKSYGMRGRDRRGEERTFELVQKTCGFETGGERKPR